MEHPVRSEEELLAIPSINTVPLLSQTVERIENINCWERALAFIATVIVSGIFVAVFIITNGVFHKDDDHSTFSSGTIWIFVEVGYASSAVLLLLYFLLEDAPFHWNRSFERLYLTGVLVLLVLSSQTLEPLEAEVRPQGNHSSNLTSAQASSTPVGELMSLMLLARILDYVESVKMHPNFHQGVGARAMTLSWVPQATPLSKRATQVLESALEHIEELKSSPHIPVTDATLMWSLFFLCIFAKTMESSPFKDHAYAINNIVNIICGLVLFVFLRATYRRNKARTICHHVGEFLHRLTHCGDNNTLQYVLANSSVGTLLEIVPWWTVQKLTEKAVLEDRLSTLSKAILIDAFQCSGLRSYRRQETVQRVLLSCRGAELTVLKSLIDGSGTYHNLFKLVYHDIRNKTLRALVLKHLKDEGQWLREQIGHRKGIKVLSDVDDTLSSSGGKFPAGCDKRWPKGAIYPGFLSLLEILDREREADMPSCNLVFLSARPHIYKDVSENYSYQRFKSLVDKGEMHSLPTLLPGNLWKGMRAMLTYKCTRTRAWQPVAEVKLSAFLQFKELYPEYDFVFCGDNGQGDLWAGQHMLERSGRYSGESRVLAVLCQQVISDDACLAKEPRAERGSSWHQGWEQKKLFFHRSYVGAALSLHLACPELVTIEDLTTVANKAIAEFDDIRLMYLEWGDQLSTAEEQLRSDLAKVDHHLQNNGQPALPHSQSMEAFLQMVDRETNRTFIMNGDERSFLPNGEP